MAQFYGLQQLGSAVTVAALAFSPDHLRRALRVVSPRLLYRLSKRAVIGARERAAPRELNHRTSREGSDAGNAIVGRGEYYAGKVLQRAPGKDTISIIDIKDRENPKILTNLELENSIFVIGPRLSGPGPMLV